MKLVLTADMSKGMFLLLVSLCLVQSAFADEQSLSSIYDFSAPVVTNTNDINASTSGIAAGTIVFDQTNARFFGLNAGGSWLPMSFQAGFPNNLNTVGSRGTQTIESAWLALSASPSVLQTSSNWLSASTITRNSTGNYTIGIAGFSSTPICSCTPAVGASDTNTWACYIAATTVSNSLVLKTQENGVAQDGVNVTVQCTGNY